MLWPATVLQNIFVISIRPPVTPCVCRDHKNISKYYRHFILFDPWKKIHVFISIHIVQKQHERIYFYSSGAGFLIPQPVCPKLHSLFWHNVRQQKHQKTYGFSQTSTYTHCFPFIYTMYLGYFLVRSRIRNK